MPLRKPALIALLLFAAATKVHARAAVETIKGYVPLETASIKNCISQIWPQWVGDAPPKTTGSCNMRANLKNRGKSLSAIYSYQIRLKYREGEMYNNKTVIIYSGESSLPENCLELYLDREIGRIKEELADHMCARFEGSAGLQFAELVAPQTSRRVPVAQ